MAQTADRKSSRSLTKPKRVSQQTVRRTEPFGTDIIFVRRRETTMFCGNNMGSLWIIIILILLFGCGGFGTGCCNECGGNNCGCGC